MRSFVVCGLVSMAGLVPLNPVLANEGRSTHPDQHPYRVRIEVVFGDDPELTQSIRIRTIRDLRSRIRSVLGTAWVTEVVDDRQRTVSSVARLRSLEAVDLLPGDAGDLDKVFVVAVPGRDPGDPLGRLEVGGVELDVATGHVGAVVTRSTGRTSQLGSTLLAVVQGAFAPIAVAERLAGDEVTLRPLAAALGPPDESVGPLRPGTTLVPFLRYFERKGELVRVQPVPWTFLRVGDANGTIAKASIVSGYRAPLGTRINRRVQVIAVAMRRNHPTTRVLLLRKGRAGAPAAGTSVEVVRKLRTRDEAVGDALELMSDRKGVVQVPRGEGDLFSWLYVRSGRAVTARVPLFAGTVREAVLEIPDDRPRLEVEGQIELLVADLVDTVAKRETLLRRIQVLARAGDWETVDELLPELDRIPTAASFEARLDLLHTGPMTRALADGNVRATFAIEKMVDETRERMRRFLDREKIEQWKADLAEERSFDESDAARLGLE